MSRESHSAKDFYRVSSGLLLTHHRELECVQTSRSNALDDILKVDKAKLLRVQTSSLRQLFFALLHCVANRKWNTIWIYYCFFILNSLLTFFTWLIALIDRIKWEQKSASSRARRQRLQFSCVIQNCGLDRELFARTMKLFQSLLTQILTYGFIERSFWPSTLLAERSWHNSYHVHTNQTSQNRRARDARDGEPERPRVEVGVKAIKITIIRYKTARARNKLPYPTLRLPNINFH